MKNKGFTLIELIAVIVMMGMILLIVFPATSRILKSNEEKKFDKYYDSVQAAIERYARTRRDELGGIDGDGCVEDKRLSELKSFEYIKEYEEEKDVTCLSPGDFSSEQLVLLGIDNTKQYVNVRLDNKKGRITVKYSMICVRNFDDTSTMSLLYSNLIEKENTCETYVPTVTNSLYNEISNKYTTTSNSNSNYFNSSIQYVTGNPNNNYVWYSGKMWRIINFNTTDKTIKLVTDESVAIINYNNQIDSSIKINKYTTSNIYYWLQNKFLPTLKNPEKYLQDIEWNYTGSSNGSYPVGSENRVLSKVGTIDTYEYEKAANYLNIGKNFLLITPYINPSNNTETNDKVWYVNTSGTVTNGVVSNFYGIRPSVVLKPNITYIYGGDGTINNPYKLIGDTSANIGAKLNDRFPGEYVTVHEKLYRISSIDSKYTKLIATETIPIDSSIASTISNIQSSNYNAVAGTIGFHFYDYLYSDNTYIGSYLRLWGATLDELLTEGDFCRMTIVSTTAQSNICPQESIINSKIAVPMISDMFAINYNKQYWTSNNKDNSNINVINPDCSISNISTESLSSILPVLSINNGALITGGNGTINNPYTIE